MNLATRQALVILLALVATWATAGLLVFWAFRDEPDGRPDWRAVPGRIIAAVRTIDALPPDLRPSAALALSRDGLDLRLSAEPMVRAGEAERRAGPLRRRLRAGLGDRELRVARGPGLSLAVTLDGGGWLGIELAGAEPPGPLWPGIVARIVAVGAVIALISIWAARRLARPLAEFAAAAERLGTEGYGPELPLKGPTELRQATAAFNRMQERLKRFLDDRVRMLAAMSHDLRTPVTRMRLRAELLEEGEVQDRMLADLEAMTAMIDATLAFMRDDAATEERLATDLGELLETVVADAVDAGGEVTLAAQAHVIVRCGPVAMRRALTNLLDNALKYGTRARVRLVRRGAEAVVTIEDDGPGIPAAEQEAVFRPFHRLEGSRNATTGGTGLGLAVARGVVRGHGGDVVLSNLSDHGLRVEVVLPLAAASRDAARGLDIAAPHAEPPTKLSPS